MWAQGPGRTLPWQRGGTVTVGEQQDQNHEDSHAVQSLAGHSWSKSDNEYSAQP